MTESWLTLIIYIDLNALGYCISNQFSVESKWERTVSLSVKTAYLENPSVKPAHLEILLDSVQDSANP